MASRWLRKRPASREQLCTGGCVPFETRSRVHAFPTTSRRGSAMTTSDYELDTIRRAVDIIRLVGRYVRLRKVGVQYVGLCPFHKEHTPSFYVHPAKKLWKCFGCGAGGDMFDFIEAIEGLNFV